MGAFEKDVRDGLVPKLTIDADSPWIEREDVPLDAPQGRASSFTARADTIAALSHADSSWSERPTV